MKIRRPAIDPPRIEMLPLIDIVFLLLVFFIYAMLSMAVHNGLPVDLPTSGTVAPDTDEAIAITIQQGEQGIRLFLDDQPLTPAQLENALARRTTPGGGGGTPRVQIFADRTVTYQDLFQVLDSVRRAGLTSLSLQADVEETARP